MKKLSVFFILALIIGITQFPVCLNAKSPEGGKDVVQTGKLPQILSPEETLKNLLNAFIARDIDAVMDYFQNNKGMEEWRKRTRMVFQHYMTEGRHIKAIESIKLIKIETDKTTKTASLQSTVVTTKKLNATVTCDEKGKCTSTMQWYFKQFKPNGPWYWDGGGI